MKSVALFLVSFLLAVLAGPIIGFTFYKLRQILFGTLPPWDPAFQARTRPLGLRILFVAIPMATPWLVLLGFLMPFTVMSEPGDPWYLPYTSIWGFVAILVFYPTSYLTTLFGEPFSCFSSWALRLCWAALLSSVIFAFLRGRPRRGASAA